MARTKVSPWGFIGMGALACVLFLDLATAGIAPWWVTAVFVLLWLALFALGARWFLSRPRAVPALAVVAFAVWLPTIVVGTSRLGWS